MKIMYSLIPPGWRSEIILGLIVALYMAAGWAASIAAGTTDRFFPVMYIESAGLFGYVLAKAYLFYFVLRLFIRAVLRHPPCLRAFVREELRAGPLNRERWLRAAPVFLAVIVMLSVFTSMKVMIPDIHPFSWDAAFLALDRALHLGVDPWRILDPVLGAPLPTYIINLVYNIWLPLLFIVLYWQLFSLQAPRARIRFFIAFALTWPVVGTLLAAVFSSAGPCFLERLTGDGYFAPLMDRLAQAHTQYDIMALGTQDMLWDTYQSGRAIRGGGISAMPSIHVATALLYLLMALRTRSRWRAPAALFLAAIMAGSVHLGWHYAVDGYAAIAVTLVLWRLSGVLARDTGAPDAATPPGPEAAPSLSVPRP